MTETTIPKLKKTAASCCSPKKHLHCILFTIGAVLIGVLATMYVEERSGFGGGDPVVAQYNGKSVRASEALAPVKARLFDLDQEFFRTKEKAINDYINAKLLEDKARNQNISKEQLIEKEAGDPSVEVTDKDIETFLRSKGLSLNDPRSRKEDVRKYLKSRQSAEHRQAYLSRLRDEAKVELLVQRPEGNSKKGI